MGRCEINKANGFTKRTGGVNGALMFAGTALAAVLSSPSLAQDAPSETPATRANPTLEDIVITADRPDSYGADYVQAGSFRGARAIDTPLTVSVIPQQVIDSQQALMLFDALRNTAGVSPSQVTPTVYSNIAIRGINVENRGNYRLNGSLPIVNLIDLPLEDKFRVEALKGASALYYGFSAPSGVVNMTMKRPTEDPYAAVRLFGNEFGGSGAHVDLGGTYGMFGARINVVEAYVDPGIDFTSGDRRLLAGAFDFKPTDYLTFNLDFEYIEKEVVEPAVWRYGAQPTPTVADPEPALPLPPLLDPTYNFGQNWTRNYAEETNVLFRANWEISSAWQVTFEAGRSELSRDRRFNTWFPVGASGATTYTALEASFASGVGAYRVSAQPNSEFVNENIRAELAGTFYTGPLLHELLIGASQNVRDANNPNTVNTTFTGYNFRSPPVLAETPFHTPTYSPTKIDDVGYYVFDRIKLGETLHVLLGVRQSDYTESNEATGVVTFSDDPVSYSWGLVYKPRSWISLYATYIEGLETTARAPVTAVNGGEQLPPAESTQYEYGLKIEPYRGLLFQGAYFDIERGSAYLNTANVWVLDGQARYEGVELSLTGEVTDDLSLYASALFLDAVQSQAQPGTFTVQGNRIENTPELTWSLAAEYRFSQWLPGLSASAAIYYVGDRAINAQNQAFIPDYTLYDLGVAYQTELFGRQMTFRLNGENITDERYFASTGASIIAPGAPGVVKFSFETVF